MSNSFYQKSTVILGVIAVFMTFLLPIKFGMITGTPEVAFTLPETFMTLMLFNWPPALFSFSAGLLLFAVVSITPPYKKQKITPHLMIAISWVCLFLSSLPGIINASVVDFTVIQLVHFAGLACFALALHRLLQLRPELKEWLINAIIASTLLTAFMGLNQFISGFQATLDYVYKQELETGVKLASNMQFRLNETRIFSTFSICNSLAAHLILTIPISIWGIVSKLSVLKTVIAVFAAYTLLMIIFADIQPIIFFMVMFLIMSTAAIALTRLDKSNSKYIKILMLLVGTGLLLFILRYTNSRGGMLAFAASLVFMGFIMPIKKKFKLLLAIVIPLIIAPVVFTDIFERSLSSMNVRFDYFLSALKIFAKHIFAGTGWGDFFHDYTQIKLFPGSEAPHTPHNFVLAFASQAGILGLIASFGVILLPFILFLRSKPIKNINWLNIVIITGWCGWCVHSFIDFNIQVAGTAATGIVMLLLMQFGDDDRENKETTLSDTKSRGLCYIWYICSVPLSLILIFAAFNRLKVEHEYAELAKMCNHTFSQKETPPPPFGKIELQLNKTGKLMPYSPFPWMVAGNAAQKRHDWARSELYYMEAIKRSPERASLYYRISVSQRYLGKRKESLNNMQKAAKLFPNCYKDRNDEYRQELPWSKFP